MSERGSADRNGRNSGLSEQYHNGLVPPMVMAKEFYSYRRSHGITQQELARRTGITPGTIHHYESLIRTLDPRARQTS